jgi:hypothetical protein
MTALCANLDDWSRRKARVVDGGLGCVNWAESRPTEAAQGTAGMSRIPLKNAVVEARSVRFAPLFREANSAPLASCGEDGRREGDEFRQFPQILGSGGQ